MEYRLPNHPLSRISDPLSVLDSDELDVPYWTFLTTLLDPITSIKLNHVPGEAASVNSPPVLLKIYEKFTNALETIAYSLNGNGSSDSSLLFAHWPDPLSSNLVQRIVHTALQLPVILPEGYLPVLEWSSDAQPSDSSVAQQTVSLTTEQVTCIICHMVLGTLPKPPWATVPVGNGGGFSWDGPNLAPAWFADDGKGSKEIKSAYIRVLLAYLDSTLLDYHSSDLNNLGKESGCVTYRLVGDAIQDVDTKDPEETTSIDLDWTGALSNILLAQSETNPRIHTHSLVPLRIIKLDGEEDDDSEECFTVKSAHTTVCQIVSANTEIGFGPAATQEERIFGAVPALLPAVLFTPRLRPNEGLLVSGDGIRVFARFKGHLRSARLERIYSGDEEEAKEGTVHARRGRQFLFLDALEMDGELHGRDAELAFVKRELRKLVVGFDALVRYPCSGIDEPHHLSRDVTTRERERDHVVVVVPPWGCGTFGGDFKVKLLLIWLAASIVGSPDAEPPPSKSMELRLSVKKAWWENLDVEWRMFLEAILRDQYAENTTIGGNIAPSTALPWTVGMLWNKVRGMGRR